MLSPGTSLLRNSICAAESSLHTEVSAGLSREPKELLPKYFYDERGSRLFERICELPEYYQTRTERSIILAHRDDLMSHVRPATIVELGAGSAAKSRLLIEAARPAGHEITFVPVDISPVMLLESAGALRSAYPWLRVRPVVGDFTKQFDLELSTSPRLVLFLGGTIGNFDEVDGAKLLRRVSEQMNSGDRLLLGVDLVKDPLVLHSAYNDAAGVTEEFNVNVLRVLNRELGAAFDLGKFRHYAFYNPAGEQIEMHLASLDRQTVQIDLLKMEFAFARGETIRTEISRKFSRASAERLLQRSGFTLERFLTDDRNYFALCLACPSGGDS